VSTKYSVLVDWDGTGTLTKTAFLVPWQAGTSAQVYEDVGDYVRSDPGINTVRGRDQIRSLAPPMAGSASCDVDNQARNFSPENTSSPLYGNLIPGRKVQIQAAYGGTVYYLFTGYLDDIPQHPERSRRSVSLPSLGTLSRLANKRVSTALYSSITTDVALGHLLDAAGWPAADRVLDTGKTTLDWWWLQDEDAFSAAVTLLNTEGPGASLYEDGQGRIVFESRTYRMTTARSTVSQATISDTGAEPLFSESFAYNPGLKDIINVAEVTIVTRSAAPESSFWQLGQAITLAANETQKFVASSSEPFMAAVTPTSPTDYAVTSGSVASLTMDRASGQSCTITLTAGPSGAVLTGLQLRAQLVTVDTTTIAANTVDATSSIANYGRQVYTLSTRQEIPLETARDLVNALVGRYQDPRPTVTITVNNGTSDRMAQILTREISDRITIVEAQTGVNHDYWIERIEHHVDEAGLSHSVRFGCEKALPVQYAVWDTAVWDTSLWGY